MKCYWRFLLVLPFIFSNAAISGVSVDSTRIIFNEEKANETISVKNDSLTKAYLIQSWVEYNKLREEKKPFIFTPPIFRLDAGNKHVMRMIKIGKNLPSDRETVYWVDIKAIPEVERNNAAVNKLQLSFTHRMRLYYQPIGLKGNKGDAAKSLSWRKTDRTITAVNNNNWTVNLNTLRANGHAINVNHENSLIPAYGSVDFNLSNGISHVTNVEWSVLSDHAAISPYYIFSF